MKTRRPGSTLPKRQLLSEIKRLEGEVRVVLCDEEVRSRQIIKLSQYRDELYRRNAAK